MDHVIVLTAPAARGLSDGEIARAASMPHTDVPRRLGADAAEISCPGVPDLSGLRASLPGIDVNAVPAAGRRKRMLIADMDSTIISVECIDEIADFVGVKPQVSAITERAMRGELDFESSLRARVALLRGLPEARLADVYAERVRLNPGARTLVRTMGAHGAHAMLVSGGFTFFAARVATAAGFAEHHANILLFADGRLTGKVAEPILGRAAKLEALVHVAGRLGAMPAEALAVGDGANDLAMVEAAGLGVAYHAKPALEAGADAVIRHADLTALLYLQGYSRDEFLRD